MPPVVIHLVISLAPGGLERLVVDWTNTRNQRDPGSTRIVCLDEPGALAVQVDGDNMDCLYAKRARWPFDVSAVYRLRKKLHQICLRGITATGGETLPVVLHSHNAAAWQYGALACWGTNLRHIHTEHGTNPHYRGRINRLRTAVVRRMTDRIVAVSVSTAADLAAHHKIPLGDIVVIPNGVGRRNPQSRIQKSAFRAQAGIPNDARVIGTVGRLAFVKGIDRLIAAFAALNNLTTYLLLVGAGPERDALERQVQESGVADRVIFAGYQADPAPCLAAMDVFALPSRSEGLSVALLEAMAAGVPVAVTDVGANREVIEDGKCGVLLPVDERQWPEILAMCITDVACSKARTEAAQARVHSHYSLATTLDAYEKLYAP